MSAMNSETGWGWPARVLHWVMAFLIIGMLVFGTYMSNFQTDLIAQYNSIQTHKSIGFTVFVLALVRVVWRLMQKRTPTLPADMPGWQRSASHVSHALLYILIVAMPLSGWLMASASPLNDEGAYPIQIRNMVFGLFEMPDPFPTGDKALTETLLAVHATLAILLAVILLVHVAAAVKHHVVDRDRILMRMVKGR